MTGEPLLDETWRLLRHLPVRQRTVLVLRIHLDLPDEEIAGSCTAPNPPSARLHSAGSQPSERN